MTSELLVCLISLIGSIIGTVSGILINSKLIDFRLKSLEEKQTKFNNVIQRTFIVEGRLNEVDIKLHNDDQRINKLEDRLDGAKHEVF